LINETGIDIGFEKAWIVVLWVLVLSKTNNKKVENIFDQSAIRLAKTHIVIDFVFLVNERT